MIHYLKVSCMINKDKLFSYENIQFWIYQLYFTKPLTEDVQRTYRGACLSHRKAFTLEGESLQGNFLLQHFGNVGKNQSNCEI